MYYELKKYYTVCDCCGQSATIETSFDIESHLLERGWKILDVGYGYGEKHLKCTTCVKKEAKP